jgi:AraC-like DNA-binding protein
MQENTSAESITFVRPIAVPGGELIVANNSPKKWRVFHETYTICSCARVATDWRYGNKAFYSADRSNMLMEPGETHLNVSVYKPADYRVLLIPPALLKEMANEAGVSTTPHLKLPCNNDQNLYLTLFRFCSAVQSGESLLEQQSLFAACVSLFLDKTERKPALSRVSNAQFAVSRIKQYLRERFAESVGLDELVALSGLSRFHLVRTFARYAGITPHAFQIHLRLNRARELLKAGIPPTIVSADVGFSDQSHFTRHFKSVWGITPSRYANAVRL